MSEAPHLPQGGHAESMAMWLAAGSVMTVEDTADRGAIAELRRLGWALTVSKRPDGRTVVRMTGGADMPLFNKLILRGLVPGQF